MKKPVNKKFKAFSIIEMLVTMAIFAILVVMLLNSLLLNIRLSTKINVRSTVRSNIDELVAQIERDIRNADSIEVAECTGSACAINVEGVEVRWRQNGTKIIRTAAAGNQDKEFESNSNLYIVPNSLNFQVLSSDSDSQGQFRFVNVIITFQAESNALELGCDKDTNNNGCKNSEPGDVQWVENQVRHFSVSTRNYLIN